MIVFLLLFILISFHKLDSSHYKFEKLLLKSFSTDSDKSLNFLTLNLDNLLNSYSFSVETLVFKDIKPSIYLYNTHDNEKYSDNTSVIDATKLLKDNLNKLGIKAICEDKLVSNHIHTGISKYDISRSFIKNIMENNKDIAYYIDIHRDSSTDTTVKINNKSYAKILFVLGLSNENYLKNKSILLKMNEYLNENYPGISKGIYEKKGANVDGVYNQDLDENVLLIEIGGVKNNIEEVNNSTEIIALMLYHMLGD